MPDVKYLVPTETAAVLGKNYPLKCDNMGLILARYLPFEIVRNGKEDMILNDRGRPEKTIRADWLKKLTDSFTRDRLLALQDAVLQRWLLTVEGSQIFEMRARTRLVVGLGGKGALEFGMTLHHTTGLPIIPGSALKGAARNYALWTIAAEVFKDSKPEDWQTNESLDALDKQLMEKGQVPHPLAESYRRIFGSQEASGECVFHDAVISRLPKETLFSVDVMTPHFKDYYTSSGTKPPHDGDNPNPVSFLTVSTGTHFGFAVGQRHGLSDPDQMLTAARWLASALDEMGIGAKTAAGYGAFKLVE